jgi:hypothetical protein
MKTNALDGNRGRAAAVLLCALLCPAGGGRAAEGENTPWHRERLAGQSRTMYQYQSAGDEKDSDLYEYLYVRGRGLGGNRLDFYGSGKLHWDLDDAGTQADDLYAGIEDRARSEQYLYQAYIEGHDPAGRVRLRGGRQYVDIADSLHLDGAQLILWEQARLGGRLFGGLPVSYYSSVSDDWAAGASLLARPWEENQTRLTFVQYHDESRGEDDHRLGLDSRQRLPADWRTRLVGSLLNDRFEAAGFDLYYLPGEGALDGSFSVRRWGGADGETRQYSPLQEILGDLEPYTYLTARLTKGVLPWLFVSPGVAARLVSSADEDAQNRDYRRYDLTVSAQAGRAWLASVAAEYWNVDEGDSFVGASGEIRYRNGRRWEASAGSGYYRYEYARYSDFTGTINAGDVRVAADGTRIENTPDSYSYFLRGKWNVTKSVSVQARVDVEDSSDLPDLAVRGRTALVVRF